MGNIKMSKNWRADLEEAAAPTIAQMAAEAEADVIEAVPVDTGHLKSTVFSEVVGMSFRVGATADYAAAVELGTSKTKAQPYLRPAVLKER